MPFLLIPLVKWIAVAAGEALFKHAAVQALDHIGVDDDTVNTVADALGVKRDKAKTTEAP